MLKFKDFKKPVIEYENRKYIFSIKSLIILAIAAPISAYLIYLFFDTPINYWLHEIVVKQTVYFLNLFFNMGAEAIYIPGGGKYYWLFSIPSTFKPRSPIYFETFCTGVQAIVVFIGIIVFSPHSQDASTREDIIWRKTKALIISSLIFYVVNIIRMLIQIELYYIGYEWADIHFSISAASSFIAAIIVLLLHKWIPEFILSIIYVGTLVTEPVKMKRKEKIKDVVSQTNKVELKLMGKVLRMEKKNFDTQISKWAIDFGYKIEGDYLFVSNEQTSDFIKLLMKVRPFER